MSENEALRFFDWFVFDYQHDAGEERLLQIYRDERWDDLSSQQQTVLEQWAEVAPAGAYTLVDYEGQRLHLRDFLSGEVVEVYDPAGRGEADVGDVILGRLLPVLDHLEFGAGTAYLPQDEIADLAEKVEAARAADAEQHPGATPTDFLRRHNHLFIHHALQQAELQGRPPVARLDESANGK